MKAAEKGNMDICTKLLKMGANPFLTDNMNRRADLYAEITHPSLKIHEMMRAYMQTIIDDNGGSQQTQTTIDTNHLPPGYQDTLMIAEQNENSASDSNQI